MQIEWRGKPAPDISAETGKSVWAEGTSNETDLKGGFLRAAAALGRDLAAKGAAPAHIERLTIAVPDTEAFMAALKDMDLLYREALAGNSGLVALIESDGAIRLQAQAVIPPASNEIVFAGYTRSDLNRQYSPRATVPEAPDIMARWRREGTANQAKRSAVLNYGADDARAIDIFLPSSGGEDRPPLHVYIHGGYWQALDKRDNGQFGAGLVEAGIAVAVLNYPLCPPATVGGIVTDCRDALACLYQEADKYGYDRDWITISGHSAGGHLVGMLAATDWTSVHKDLPRDLIKGTVAISGLFEVEPLVHTGLNKALRLTVEQAREISPIRYPVVSPGPIIAAVGGAESDEFRRQSRDYVDHLLGQGVQASYLELPGLNHFTAVEAMADRESVLYTKTVELASRAESGSQVA